LVSSCISICTVVHFHLDTTDLSSRALLTSTISIPWLITTWIGPPIGAWFVGKALEHPTTSIITPPSRYYRIPYLAFAILIPLGALCWAGIIWNSWKKVTFEQNVIYTESPTASRSESPTARRGSESRYLLRDKGGRSVSTGIREILNELDVIGLLLLCVGCTGILVPLSMIGGEITQGAISDIKMGFAF
jgi:hypothetical protein